MDEQGVILLHVQYVCAAVALAFLDTYLQVHWTSFHSARHQLLQGVMKLTAHSLI